MDDNRTTQAELQKWKKEIIVHIQKQESKHFQNVKRKLLRILFNTLGFEGRKPVLDNTNFFVEYKSFFFSNSGNINKMNYYFNV